MFDLPRSSCNWNIAGTTTFRLASKMMTKRLTHPPRDGKCGGNLQNLEHSISRVFMSDGWDSEDELTKEKLADYLVRRDKSIFTEEELSRIKILVQPDQSGAEALIVAYLCRHGNFRELFLNGIKSHVYVGMFVFKDIWKRELETSGTDIKADIELMCNTPISELTKNPFWKTLDKLIKSSDRWTADKRYYYISKQICHSSNYGIKASMFQLNTLEKSRGKIALSLDACKNYLSIYHGLFPEIHEWHRELERQLTETRILYNLFGYPRYFWYPLSTPNENILKEAYAFPAQSTVGTITNIALTNMQQYIEDCRLRWDILNNKHDSYLAQCPIGEEKECARVMQGFITDQVLIAPSDGTKFHMKSEVQIGFNWGENDKHNKLGLVSI